MTVREITSLMWRGHQTAELARASLDRHERVLIHLPSDYHHALFVTLRPEAPRGTPEELDVHDGPRLLTTIASIRGLEEFSILVEPARRSGVSVTIRSPAPEISLLPSDE